jgi:hypothetical protein
LRQKSSYPPVVFVLSCAAQWGKFILSFRVVWLFFLSTFSFLPFEDDVESHQNSNNGHAFDIELNCNDDSFLYWGNYYWVGKLWCKNWILSGNCWWVKNFKIIRNGEWNYSLKYFYDHSEFFFYKLFDFC